MNLSQLYYFRKLAAMQHYTKAAKELFITQPTLSGSISSLEQELGVSLFQKSGRNVELTKYGAEFLLYVNDALDKLDKGVAIMKGYSGESDGGTIDIGAIITIQSDFLPELIRSYQASNQHHYEFNISQAASGVLLEGLSAGRHDVVFAAKDDGLPDIEYVPLLEQRIVVAIREDSPLAKKPYVLPEDIVKLDLLSYRSQTPIGKALRAMAESLSLERLNQSYDDESILAGFAAKGPDAALMLDTNILHTVDGLKVLPLYLDDLLRKEFFHTIYLAYSTKNYHPYCVDSFIEHVSTMRIARDEERRIYID